VCLSDARTRTAARRSCPLRKLLDEVEGDPILEPTVLAVLGNARAMQGQVDQAQELLERWRRGVMEFGDSIWLFAINFGWVMLADDPVAAENELRPGYEALLRLGEKSHFSSVAGLLARAVCAQGRYDEAERLTHESEEAARPNDIHSHILWRTARSQVLAQRKELDRAEQLAVEAVSFAATSDFLDSHADAMMNLAELRLVAGRQREAAGHIEEALRLYEQKGTSSRPNALDCVFKRSRRRDVKDGLCWQRFRPVARLRGGHQSSTARGRRRASLGSTFLRVAQDDSLAFRCDL
jgi:tetratricopeptide (TPR) repeat protein